MKMRSLNRAVVMLVLLTMASPAMADINGSAVAETTSSRAQQLENRLEEIKNLDRSNLSRTEKKGLRREVREIKKELAAISGGVYLSIGAIILIALLLILLL